MTEISRIVKILEKLSSEERREVLDFAEFLLARRASVSEIPAREDDETDAYLDEDDYDDRIR